MNEHFIRISLTRYWAKPSIKIQKIFCQRGNYRNLFRSIPIKNILRVSLIFFSVIIGKTSHIRGELISSRIIIAIIKLILDIIKGMQRVRFSLIFGSLFSTILSVIVNITISIFVKVSNRFRHESQNVVVRMIFHHEYNHMFERIFGFAKN